MGMRASGADSYRPTSGEAASLDGATPAKHADSGGFKLSGGAASQISQERRMSMGFSVTSCGKVSGYQPVPASPNLSPNLSPNRSPRVKSGARSYEAQKTSVPIHMQWDCDGNGVPDGAEPHQMLGTNLDYEFDLDRDGIPDDTQVL